MLKVPVQPITVHYFTGNVRPVMSLAVLNNVLGLFSTFQRRQFTEENYKRLSSIFHGNFSMTIL